MLALVPFWYSRLAFMQTYHRYLRQAALGAGNFLPPAGKASAHNHFVSALLLKDRMYSACGYGTRISLQIEENSGSAKLRPLMG